LAKLKPPAKMVISPPIFISPFKAFKSKSENKLLIKSFFHTGTSKFQLNYVSPQPVEKHFGEKPYGDDSSDNDYTKNYKSETEENVSLIFLQLSEPISFSYYRYLFRSVVSESSQE
jgi:hypothetical protein